MLLDEFIFTGFGGNLLKELIYLFTEKPVLYHSLGVGWGLFTGMFTYSQQLPGCVCVYLQAYISSSLNII